MVGYYDFNFFWTFIQNKKIIARMVGYYDIQGYKVPSKYTPKFLLILCTK